MEQVIILMEQVIILIPKVVMGEEVKVCVHPTDFREWALRTTTSLGTILLYLSLLSPIDTICILYNLNSSENLELLL